MRALVLLLALCVSACQETRRLALDVPVPENTGSLLVAVLSDRAPELYAVEVGERVRGAPVIDPYDGEPLELVILDYAEPLSALALEPGRVPPPGPGELARALPTPRGIARARVMDSDLSPLVTEPQLPSELGTLRLPNPAPEHCYAAGGCFDRQGGATQICHAPCAVETPKAPMPPAAPLAPVLSACPAGFVIDAELGVCSAGAVRPNCPAGERAAAGGRCLRVDLRCGDQDYSNELPQNAVLFVRSGAEAGDGSRESPFASLAAALAAAKPGDTIALSRGQFTLSGGQTIPADVVLEGACEEETTLESDTLLGGTFRRLAINAPQLSVRNRVRLERVRLDVTALEALGVLELSESALRAEEIAVAGTLALESSALVGARIEVQGPNGRLELSESVAHDLDGLTVQAGAESRIASSVLWRLGGLWAAGRVQIERAEIVEPTRTPWRFAGGQLTVSASLLRGLSGLSAEGGTLNFQDSVVLGGDLTSTGGRLQLARTRFVRLSGPIRATESVSVLSDLSLRGSVPGAVETGLVLVRGETTLERFEAIEQRAAGLYAEGTRGRALDLTVTDTSTSAVRGFLGAAVELIDVEFDVAGLRLADNAIRSLRVQSRNRRVQIEDLEVSSTGTIPADVGLGEFQDFGFGAAIAGDVVLARARFSDNNMAAIDVEPKSELRATDLHIAHTTATPTFPGIRYPYGEAIRTTCADLQLERFLLEDNAITGIRIFGGGQFSVRRGLIRGSPSAVTFFTSSEVREALSEILDWVKLEAIRNGPFEFLNYDENCL